MASEPGHLMVATELLSQSWRKRKKMLHWSLVFLVIALIAAVLGFGGVAGAAAGIAKVLFFVFLVVWLLSMFIGRRAL